MTPGEIGCSLSHMAVYRRMIDENIESLVVLEDDARISADLRSVLERAGQWPHDWDILFLYHQGNDANHISLRKRVQLGPRHCIVRFSDRPLGTVAYAVRSSAARKLLCAGLPISAPADELLNGYASRISLCRYGIHPVVVEHACSNDSFLAAERMRANASLHMTTFSLSRFLPNSLYRRGRRCVKFGKRFFRRYIV
jgi:glycosyl transferase family 25